MRKCFSILVISHIVDLALANLTGESTFVNKKPDLTKCKKKSGNEFVKPCMYVHIVCTVKQVLLPFS